MTNFQLVFQSKFVLFFVVIVALEYMIVPASVVLDQLDYLVVVLELVFVVVLEFVVVVVLELVFVVVLEFVVVTSLQILLVIVPVVILEVEISLEISLEIDYVYFVLFEFLGQNDQFDD